MLTVSASPHTMRRGTFLLAGSICLGSLRPPQSPALFRYISLGFTRIELGTDFANPVLSRAIDDSTRQLRDVTFGGAETIKLRYDQRRVLRAILFEYPATYDWPKEVRDYASSLGRPKVLREDLRRPSAEWRDSSTVFRVWCEPGTRTRRCHAELRDRAQGRDAR